MRKSVKVGVASVGLLLIGSPAAAQSNTMTSVGNIGIANGNQIAIDPLQIPINACGNAIGVLGFAAASCQDAHATANYNSGHDHDHGYNNGHGHGNGGGGTDMVSLLNPGIANGNQADLMVQIPINLCGNAIGILGAAVASCSDASATASAFSDDGHKRVRPRPYHDLRSPVRNTIAPKADQKAKKNRKTEIGLLGGLLAPVTNLLGNQGRDKDKDMDAQPRHILGFGDHDGFGRHDRTCGDDSMTSILNPGILNGNQVKADVQVPVNLSGNAVGVLGAAVASARDTSATANYC